MSSDHPPIVCTLPVERRPERNQEWAAAQQALIERDRRPGQVRLVFRASQQDRAAIRDLARREKECCAFFDFTIDEDQHTLTMLVTAPVVADELLEHFGGPIHARRQHLR